MLKTCMENHIVRIDNSYKCYLCNLQIQYTLFEEVQEHFRVEEHITKLNEIDEKVKAKRSEIISTISGSQLRKVIDSYITFGASFDFYCHLCECPIPSLDHVFGHVQGTQHKKALKALEPVPNTKKSDALCKKLIKSDTVKNPNNPNLLKELENFDDITFNHETSIHYCNLCQCPINGQNNVVQHIKGSAHNAAMKLKNKEQKCERPHNEGKAHNLAIQLENKDESQIQCINKDNSKSQINAPYLLPIRFCIACQIFLKNKYQLQFHVMAHLSQTCKLPPDVDIITFNFSKTNKVNSQCLICNVGHMNITKLHFHLKSKIHIMHLNLVLKVKAKSLASVNLKFNLENSKNNELKCHNNFPIASLCTVCDVSVVNKDVSAHTNGKRHMLNLKQNLTTDERYQDTSDINSSIVYKCFVCELTFKSVSALFEHYETVDHRYRMVCINVVNNCPHVEFVRFDQKTLAIVCKLCKSRWNNLKLIVEHILEKHNGPKVSSLNQSTSNHNNVLSSVVEGTNLVNCMTRESQQMNNNDDLNDKAKKVMKQNNFKTSAEELVKLGFNPDSVILQRIPSNCDSLDDLLDDIVKLDLNKLQQKTLPIAAKQRIPRTPITQKKKYSLSQNVAVFGQSYIRYCINPGKANIYNRDHEKIRLIALGTTLTCPWESERLCLPCGELFPSDKQLFFEHLQNVKHLENLCEMENNDKVFKDYPDQYSDLKLAQFYMQDESDTWIQCYVCDTKISNSNDVIDLHCQNKLHISKNELWKNEAIQMIEGFSTILDDVWYYAQMFSCEVCKVKCDFEIDFVRHLENQNHIDKVNQLKSRKIDTKFDFCHVCITYWYGKSDVYSLHCENQYHKRFAKNCDFMVPEMPVNTLDLLNNIEDKVQSLIEESDRTSSEEGKELELMSAIEETVKSTYPNAKAYAFGSRISYLGFPDSDLDIFLNCEDSYHKSTTQEECKKYLKSVEKDITNRSDIWIIDEILLATRVPIIKLRYIPTALNCDISFINGLSVEKSTLIGYYNVAYPVCRKLILFLKKWLTYCQMSGSDCITTFAISWFVIFYLQIKCILPSVHTLIRQKNKSKIVDGWECGYSGHILVINPDISFKDHLHGFFHYYANFDYKTHVACPYLGKMMEKRSFAYIDGLPKEMKLYKTRVNNKSSEMFRFDSPMCIQDPIDLSQNITKAVRKRQLRCFRQYCSESAKKILENRDN